MKLYTIHSRKGDFIAKVSATSEIAACYATYNKVWGGYPNYGEIVEFDQDALTEYVSLGADEGPNWFDNYVVKPIE